MSYLVILNVSLPFESILKKPTSSSKVSGWMGLGILLKYLSCHLKKEKTNINLWGKKISTFILESVSPLEASVSKVCKLLLLE